MLAAYFVSILYVLFILVNFVLLVFVSIEVNNLLKLLFFDKALSIICKSRSSEKRERKEKGRIIENVKNLELYKFDASISCAAYFTRQSMVYICCFLCMLFFIIFCWRYWILSLYRALKFGSLGEWEGEIITWSRYFVFC